MCIYIYIYDTYAYVYMCVGERSGRERRKANDINADRAKGNTKEGWYLAGTVGCQVGGQFLFVRCEATLMLQILRGSGAGNQNPPFLMASVQFEFGWMGARAWKSDPFAFWVLSRSMERSGPDVFILTGSNPKPKNRYAFEGHPGPSRICSC